MLLGIDRRVARLEEDLERVRRAFESTLAAIGDDRRHRAPAGQWTPAQLVWHCAKVERGVARLVERLDAAIPEMATVPPGPAPDKVLRLLDHIPYHDRARKVQAIPGLVPPESVDLGAELGRLREGREQLLTVIRQAGPRLSLVKHEHPLFGPFDGWQWVLSVGKHEERHLDQLREVAAAPL